MANGKATAYLSGGLSIGSRHISNLRYSFDTSLLASSEEEGEYFLRLIEHVNEEAGIRLKRAKFCLIIVELN